MARCQLVLVLFRAASLRTRRTGFLVPGSPVIYCVRLCGVAEWMVSWHGRQTTIAFLRR